MLATRVRGPRQAAAALCAAAWLAGCYSYSVPGEVGPELGRTFAFEPTDQGRAALAAGIGSGTDRIEGVLVGLTDTTYSVRVARVVDIRGKVVRWSGEVVALGRDHISTVRERRRSAARTGIAIGAVTVGVVAFVATASLAVTGNETDQPPPENPPPVVASRLFPLTLHRSR
ncbi:MAG: hypothetical protein OEO20_03815 [Gemmatimonadota bacterium]|nr:hypothetical protein [Gemmatimonadota bacterium]MDH3367582.1 hypothetical protein [Gemmatimonadota bacterium]MDH3477412.1 hypothetical protein [Gemmatimonadota bacterium]MDH3569305.1 hypothetical protein [Gemmatimonadota bacterium]MDH5550707.1 hypothetical protein [Gemmatimonadota bacterium]